MAIAPGPAVSYTSYIGDNLLLYPWAGEHVAVLTRSDDRDPAVMQKIVDALDAAYEAYVVITGRTPTLFLNYNGLLQIAEVPATAGAAIGYLGFTGIEIATGDAATFGFDLLYNGVASDNVFEQALFYELGRNFWFYEHPLAFLDQFVTALPSSIGSSRWILPDCRERLSPSRRSAPFPLKK